MPKPKYKFRLYANFKYVARSNNSEKIWDAIGKLPFGVCYEVHDKNGYCVPEFIPF